MSGSVRVRNVIHTHALMLWVPKECSNPRVYEIGRLRFSEVSIIEKGSGIDFPQSI